VESSVLSRSATPTLESYSSLDPQVPDTQAPDIQAPDIQALNSESEISDFQSQPLPVVPQQQNGFRQEIRIFLSTFATIFLAELGDKTQITTLLMSAESNAPWIVFLGAGTALVATSLLGVWLGHWLSKRVSTRTLETSAAAMLLLISAMLLWDVVQG
jgi:putative Ca2+/H+ antiporter (TMEM165/GDT1 family)